MLKNVLNYKIILLMIISVFLIGCRTVPVEEISNEPIISGSGKTLKLSEVTHDIVQSGIGLGWQMKKVKAGYIIGTLILRKHMVKVDIHYSRTEYSITYNDSSEMSYDGEMIHKNYNSWVNNLSKAIRTHVFANHP